MIHVLAYLSLPTAYVLPPTVYLATVVSTTIKVPKPGRNIANRKAEMGYNLHQRHSSSCTQSSTPADLEVSLFKVKSLNMATRVVYKSPVALPERGGKS